MGEKEKDFEKLFIEAIDEGLNVLGESGKQMVFFHLQNSYSVKKHEIPKKPEVFAAGLEKIFGAGASVIEKLILKSLYTKMELKYEDKGERPFADYVKEVDDTKEARQDNSSSPSSNQQSLEGKVSRQSSIPPMEREEFSYSYR